MSEPLNLTDIHNHLIPGVDDGARSLDEALGAIAAMHEQGVRRLICTPHIDAELLGHEERYAARIAKVDTAWAGLRAAAAERFPDVELQRGHEVMVDTPRFSVGDARVRMAGTPYVLVEFPRLFVPSGTEDVLYHLRLEGYLPIVAHPERYVGTGPSASRRSRRGDTSARRPSSTRAASPAGSARTRTARRSRCSSADGSI
jgi:protein-tyrosine phosphatase